MANATGLQSDAQQCKKRRSVRPVGSSRALDTAGFLHWVRACLREGCGERSGVWRSQSKWGTVGLMVLVSHEDVDLATRRVRSAAHTRVKTRHSHIHTNPPDRAGVRETRRAVSERTERSL